MRQLSLAKLGALLAIRRPPRPGFLFARRRAAHLRLGKHGERLAGRVLAELGLEILCRNYRCRHGEIDLVARDDTMICFVEVKTRRLSRWLSRPAEAVTAGKRQRLQRSAGHYLQQIGHPELTFRFDIVEVIYDGRKPVDVRHLPDAFRAQAANNARN